MRNDWLADLQNSSSDLIRVVLPTLASHCKEFAYCSFRTIESRTKDELRNDLDARAGIDAYQRWPVAMRGIASRVQSDGINHRTFTIRESRPSGVSTEYQKRLQVIKRRDEGFLYPYWTVQAYMSEVGGDLLSVAVAKTVELYQFIEQQESGGRKLPRNVAKNGGQTFIYVGWAYYRIYNPGSFLYIYSPSEPREETT